MNINEFYSFLLADYKIFSNFSVDNRIYFFAVFGLKTYNEGFDRFNIARYCDHL